MTPKYPLDNRPQAWRDEAARHPLVAQARRVCDRYEIPTWIVIFAVYGAWLTLTFYYHAIPWYVLALAAPLVIAWQGSLRHEASHGHPINRRVATVVGYPPLGLLDPFVLYRESHQKHHRNEHLTDPYEDPESYFYRPEDWQKKSRFMQALWVFNQTFAGRMLLGPLLVYGRWYGVEIRAMLRGDRARMRIWGEHMVLVAALLYYLTQVCGIPLWQYLALFVYPGASVGMIRSFYEHRYDAEPLARCVLVEKSPFFQLLFLNNNFHAVHHDKPAMPWYQLDGYYRSMRDYYQEANRHYVVESYGKLMRDYLFTPVFYPVHPRRDTSVMPPETQPTGEVAMLVDAVLPEASDNTQVR